MILPTNEISQRIRASVSNDLVALMKIAGQSPDTAFAWQNWRGCDFAGSDIRGICFDGADLSDCNFEGALADSQTSFEDAVVPGNELRGIRWEEDALQARQIVILADVHQANSNFKPSSTVFPFPFLQAAADASPNFPSQNAISSSTPSYCGKIGVSIGEMSFWQNGAKIYVQLAESQIWNVLVWRFAQWSLLALEGSSGWFQVIDMTDEEMADVLGI